MSVIFDDLLDDRPEEQIFRVNRKAFTDQHVFDMELARIFEGTWVFVGLESQIAKPNDFLTTYIGRHPVLLTRDAAGAVGCFLNTCRHRGTIVCPFRKGNQKFHVCRYHGWSYDSGGRNIAITDEAAGQYPETFGSANHDLIQVARLDSYRGFIFASLSPDVPSLAVHLGEARFFLDIIADQAPGGLEMVEGTVSYTFDANWKLQFENGLDFYHFASTHSSYVDILRKREKHLADTPAPPSLQPIETDEEAQGSFGFERGHAVMWSIRRQVSKARGVRPIAADPANVAYLQQTVDPERLKWMFRQRNMTIFPNLQIIDISSLQLRTWRPLAPDRTEMTSNCLAIAGEAPEARRLRIRQYEEFFNPSGLATSDDNVMYEYCQTGYEAQAGGPTQGYLRGLGAMIDGRELPGSLRLASSDASYGSLSFGGETCFHAGYREWLRLLQREPAGV